MARTPPQKCKSISVRRVGRKTSDLYCSVVFAFSFLRTLFGTATLQHFQNRSPYLFEHFQNVEGSIEGAIEESIEGPIEESIEGSIEGSIENSVEVTLLYIFDKVIIFRGFINLEFPGLFNFFNDLLTFPWNY